MPPSISPRPTTFIDAPRLGERVGARVLLASEAFQLTGSFKFRAGYNVAKNIAHPRVIASSSGNFGQGISYACSLFGKTCTVVMPHNSARVKIDAVREYGGVVDLVDTTKVGRAERVAQLAAEQPDAYVASAFDDPLVIEGNSSLGSEIVASNRDVDTIIAPLGGGGLASGMVMAVKRAGARVDVVAAEPAMANDGARSLREGRIVRNESEPQTIADGARTLALGKHTWEILREGLAGIVEVPEDKIIEALRLAFTLVNLKVEPTGALAIGALLTDPARFAGRSVCCVVSGGNVDPALYASLLSGA